MSRTLWEEEARLSHQNGYTIEYLAYSEGSIYLSNDYVNDYLCVFMTERGQEGLEYPEETS